MLLTPKQKEVFLFIKKYINSYDMAPTYNEIRSHFAFRSFNSVTKHIKQLVEKDVISLNPNKKRSITLKSNNSNFTDISLLGIIAAGTPIEAIENSETISVPKSFLKSNEDYFCLKVKGSSMIEDGIFDGDIVVIKKKHTANNGEIVTALINNEATLKKFKKTKDGVILSPSNSNMKPIKVTSGEFSILGTLTGLLRKY